MSSVIGAKFDIEIDDSIREQPGLLDAVGQASSYLESRVRAAGFPDLDDMRLSWTRLPTDGGRVEVAFAVWWRFDDAHQGVSPTRLIPPKDLFDPVKRNIWMWRLWGDVLEQVSRLQLRHIEEQISELERAAGSEATDGR
jgi:hypothetical protein